MEGLAVAVYEKSGTRVLSYSRLKCDGLDKHQIFIHEHRIFPASTAGMGAIHLLGMQVLNRAKKIVPIVFGIDGKIGNLDVAASIGAQLFAHPNTGLSPRIFDTTQIRAGLLDEDGLIREKEALGFDLDLTRDWTTEDDKKLEILGKHVANGVNDSKFTRFFGYSKGDNIMPAGVTAKGGKWRERLAHYICKYILPKRNICMKITGGPYANPAFSDVTATHLGDMIDEETSGIPCHIEAIKNFR